MFEYPTNLDPGLDHPPRRHPHLSSSWSQPWARAASVWMTKVCPSKVPLQLSPTQKIFPEASQRILISGNIIFRHGKNYIKKGHNNWWYLHTSTSMSLKNSISTSCGFISVPPTPLKYNLLFSTLMTGSLTSVRQIERIMCFGLWAHIQLGWGSLRRKYDFRI